MKYKGKYPGKFNRFRKLLFKNPTRCPTDIADEVYDCKNRDVAAQIASQCLRKLNLTIEDLLDRAGLTDEHDAKFLKDNHEATLVVAVPVMNGKPDEKHPITVPDQKTRLKAFELSQRLKGRLKNMQTGDSHTHFTLNYGHRTARGKEPTDVRPVRHRPPRQPVRT